MEDDSIVPPEVTHYMAEFITKCMDTAAKDQNFELAFSKISQELDHYHGRIAMAQFLNRAFKL